VLTLSQLALGVIRGAGLQQPLATAIIFGLIAAVPLVLRFLPAATFAMARRAEPRGKSVTVQGADVSRSESSLPDLR